LRSWDPAFVDCTIASIGSRLDGAVFDTAWDRRQGTAEEAVALGLDRPSTSA